MWTYNYSTYSNELYHHGVKGMKWGVRRYQNKDGSLTNAGKNKYTTASGKDRWGTRSTTSRNGDTLFISEKKKSRLEKALGRMSKHVAEEQRKSTSAAIKVKGKKVGNLELYEESKDSLNINWININNKERGKGYAQSVLNGVFKYAKVNGYKQITLEVPGISPDAAHVYEKLGFEYINKNLSSKDDAWGGLSSMKKKL